MKKYGLLFGAIILILGGYLAYLFEFKEYNTSDAEVDVLTKEEYIIELADGSKIVLDKNGNLIRHITGTDGKVTTVDFADSLPISQVSDGAVASVTSDSDKSSAEKASVPDASNEKAVKASVKDIEEQYAPALADIEKQAYDNLDNLINLAKSEYLEMEANDQKISYPYFYNKYTGAASKLEARTDKVFEGIMQIMEHELKVNGHSSDTVDSLHKEYKNKKNKLRRDILKETAGL
ncbi:MAG TPA: hypothetical protein VLQ20_12895 [Planococcus sp. (in: firmicutes)]|nr:hypothetical protein [Planococcus sp. (in: firmicutes)]